MAQQVAVIEDPRQLQVMAQPWRVQVLEALRTPDCAAGVARALGTTRQKVNYHLKELARVGLVHHAGERRKGNFVEQLYEAAAKRFIVSPQITCDRERLAVTLQDQVALSHLAAMGEQLQRDACALIDRAAYDGEQIPNASVVAEIRFADMEARSAFMREYVAALQALLDKHGAKSGPEFRVAAAIYLNPEEE